MRTTKLCPGTRVRFKRTHFAWRLTLFLWFRGNPGLLDRLWSERFGTLPQSRVTVHKHSLMVLAVLGLVTLDPSFNGPFPHSCEQKHIVEAGCDKIQWFVLHLKPGSRFIVCAHCLRRPPRENGNPIVVPCLSFSLTAAGLVQSVERLTAEREVAGSIPGTGPILRVLKYLRNEGISFALQMGRPTHGSDDHVKWRPLPSPVGDVKYSVPNYYFRVKYIDTQIKCIFIVRQTSLKGGHVRPVPKVPVFERVDCICYRCVTCHWLKRPNKLDCENGISLVSNTGNSITPNVGIRAVTLGSCDRHPVC